MNIYKDFGGNWGTWGGVMYALMQLNCYVLQGYSSVFCISLVSNCYMVIVPVNPE